MTGLPSIYVWLAQTNQGGKEMNKQTAILAALLVAAGVLAPWSQVAAQERVVVETRSGEVVKVLGGRTVIIRNDKGELKMYSKVPEDVRLYVDGKAADISDLREGMKLNAVRWENVPAPVTVTYEQVQQMEAPAAPAAAPAPQAQPAPAAPQARPAQLPSTGSRLPFVGLAGLALALLGGGVLLGRRL